MSSKRHIEIVPRGTPAPFPSVSVRAAAKRLGVGPELIHGLAARKAIRAFPTEGKSGATVWMISVEDIDRLEREMRR